VWLCDTSGKVLHRFEAVSNISRLQFLPTGQRALGSSEVFGSPVYFFDLEGHKVAQRQEHRYQAVCLDVSADGCWAVSGGRCRFEADRNYYFRTETSEGGELVLWDLASNQPAVKLNPAVDSINAVGISPDGRWVAAAEGGDAEGRVIVFKVTGR
jgi:hypothetical protein